MGTVPKIDEVIPVRKSYLSFVRRVLNDQLGQTLPMVALGMVALMGICGLTMDIGHAYVVHSQLQNSANAAALAASGAVYNAQSDSVNSTSVANQYSASSGDQNVYSTLGVVTTTVTMKCLNVLMPKGETCGTSTVPNAVRVTNKTSVPTYFMKIFGFPTLTVGASATASMQGVSQPWNVAIIVDATSSMSTTDSNCGGLDEFHCALSGVQALLASTNPCPGGMTSCTPAQANVRMALFSFPNLDSSKFTDTSTCSGTFSNEPYTFPLKTPTSYTPVTYATAWSGSSPKSGSTHWTGTYQITDWDSGYYAPSSSSTGGLNPSDNLIKVIGYNANPTTGNVGHAGCLPNVGGETTYYGGVINAAQAALLAEQAANPGSQNALILLSDGQANVTDLSHFASGQSPAVTTLAAYGYSTLTGTGLYPDNKDQCQQAIKAAQDANNAGTTVYAVAYGSEQSGCSSSSGGTDSTTVATGQNASFTYKTLTPCVTMENIASSLNTFYSDYNQSGSGSTCQDNSHTVVTLQDIFYAISATFTTPRLIPNTAT